MSLSLAFLAFETLISKLSKSHPVLIRDINAYMGTSDSDYPENAPLFVTWNKRGLLRGCIGTFSPLPVEEAVPQYALISALEDTRFQPVVQSEIPNLSVSITILDNFTEIEDPLDWTIGAHGLKVLFRKGRRHYLGTFLPQVAEEQEWDQVETLWNLLRKAGYRGSSEDETVDLYKTLISDSSMKLVRYEGLKVGASYEEYASFKKESSVNP